MAEKTIKQIMIEKYEKKFIRGSLSEIEDKFVERFIDLTIENKEIMIEIEMLKGLTKEEARIKIYGEYYESGTN